MQYAAPNEMARSTSDPQSRATWDALAKRWLHCADVAEHAMADAAATSEEREGDRHIDFSNGAFLACSDLLDAAAAGNDLFKPTPATRDGGNERDPGLGTHWPTVL